MKRDLKDYLSVVTANETTKDVVARWIIIMLAIATAGLIGNYCAGQSSWLRFAVTVVSAFILFFVNTLIYWGISRYFDKKQ